jgi:hypothetical protein
VGVLAYILVEFVLGFWFVGGCWRFGSISSDEGDIEGRCKASQGLFYVLLVNVCG